MKIPPYLKKGDTIGITCPAGYMQLEKAQLCIDTFEAWGFKVKVGATLGKEQVNYFSGTDVERLHDLQNMLDNDDIKAVFFGRGGYGISRIIDDIDFKKFKKNPKWVCGYSDITLLHTHINKVLKTATIHAPMAAAFNDDVNSLYIQSVRKTLLGQKTNYQAAPHAFNHAGKAEGRLVGGNLALLAHSVGSKSEPDVKNKILFIEDIGEYIYNVDRMLIQLKRSGWLDKIAGLVVGSFSDMKDTTDPFGKTVEEVIKEHLKPYTFPYCFGFPVGHTEENVSLRCGLRHKFTVQKHKISLECVE